MEIDKQELMEGFSSDDDAETREGETVLRIIPWKRPMKFKVGAEPAAALLFALRGQYSRIKI